MVMAPLAGLTVRLSIFSRARKPLRSERFTSSFLLFPSMGASTSMVLPLSEVNVSLACSPSMFKIMRSMARGFRSSSRRVALSPGATVSGAAGLILRLPVFSDSVNCKGSSSCLSRCQRKNRQPPCLINCLTLAGLISSLSPKVAGSNVRILSLRSCSERGGFSITDMVAALYSIWAPL